MYEIAFRSNLTSIALFGTWWIYFWDTKEHFFQVTVLFQSLLWLLHGRYDGKAKVETGTSFAVRFKAHNMKVISLTQVSKHTRSKAAQLAKLINTFTSWPRSSSTWLTWWSTHWPRDRDLPKTNPATESSFSAIGNIVFIDHMRSSPGQKESFKCHPQVPGTLLNCLVNIEIFTYFLHFLYFAARF